MIPYSIIVNGNKRDVNMPTSWNEISEVQALALAEVDPKDKAGILEILLQVPREQILALPGKKFDMIYEKTAYLFTDEKPDFSKIIKPKYITIRGKKYSTNLDPKKIPHGYLELIRSKLQEIEAKAKEISTDENPIEPKYFDHCSLYIAYAMAGKVFTREEKKLKRDVPIFNEELAHELLLEIQQMPFVQVYPIGCFFLRKLLIYFELQQVNFIQNTMKMRLKQEHKQWKGLRFFQRWAALLKTIGRKRNSTSKVNAG
jgi:hypothetical protein